MVVIVFSGLFHLIAGLLIGFFIFPSYNILLIVLGAILPDADIKGSIIGKILPLWLIFKHRGFTHTVWGLLLFTGLFWYFWEPQYAISLGIGYLTHLILDSFTPKGVKWFG